MQANLISRQEAIAFLETPRPSWTHILGQQQKIRVMRNPRGAGGKVDLRCYAGYSPAGKPVVVARIGMTPYGGAPAKAALGNALAPHTCYLMRLAAAGGLTHEDVVSFIGSMVTRLRADLGGRFRYLLSLDSPEESLISVESFGDILTAARAATGRCYLESGALDAGQTNSRRQTTRYVTSDGEIRSVYRNGHNFAAQIPPDCHPIKEGVKRRFVWVLGEKSSIEYAAWRRVLPAWVCEPEWGRSGLGWTQPRLLVRRTHLGVAAHGQVNDLVQLAIASFGHLLHFGEELSGEAFAERIAQTYDERSPRTQAVLAGMR